MEQLKGHVDAAQVEREYLCHPLDALDHAGGDGRKNGSAGLEASDRPPMSVSQVISAPSVEAVLPCESIHMALTRYSSIGAISGREPPRTLGHAITDIRFELGEHARDLESHLGCDPRLDGAETENLNRHIVLDAGDLHRNGPKNQGPGCNSGTPHQARQPKAEDTCGSLGRNPFIG